MKAPKPNINQCAARMQVCPVLSNLILTTAPEVVYVVSFYTLAVNISYLNSDQKWV